MNFFAFFKTLFVLVGLFISSYSVADSISGKVKLVEPGYMPYTVSFIMDADSESGTCKEDDWVVLSTPDVERNKATLSILTSALMGNKSVNVYLDNNTCDAHGVHLIK